MARSSAPYRTTLKVVPHTCHTKQGTGVGEAEVRARSSPAEGRRREGLTEREHVENTIGPAQRAAWMPQLCESDAPACRMPPPSEALSGRTPDCLQGSCECYRSKAAGHRDDPVDSEYKGGRCDKAPPWSPLTVWASGAPSYARVGAGSQSLGSSLFELRCTAPWSPSCPSWRR